MLLLSCCWVVLLTVPDPSALDLWCCWVVGLELLPEGVRKGGRETVSPDIWTHSLLPFRQSFVGRSVALERATGISRLH